MGSPDKNDTKTNPVWAEDNTTDVQSMFKNPQFIPDEQARSKVAKAWYDGMSTPGDNHWWGNPIYLYDDDDLAKPRNNVFEHGPRIYEKLSPGASMPYAVDGYKGKFPEEALERFRTWYNQGGRKSKTDDINPVESTKIINHYKETPGRTFKIVPGVVPVWDSEGKRDTATFGDDIKMAFTNPCWIANEMGASTASNWQDAMLKFQYDPYSDPIKMFDIQDYDCVKGWARSVYDHVASKAMPIEEPFFSDEAVEAIRLWYNGGCPKNTDAVKSTDLPKNPIPKGPVEQPFLVRKDINTLSDAELYAYRMALIKLRTDAAEDSLWQTGGFLHANWCLHYMEASFPWHRAHLLWLETQIGMPIPYWNFYSSEAANPDSPDSGIPKAFLDESFQDSNGQITYPNPLRYALGRGGVSRSWTAHSPTTFVTRADAFIQKDNDTAAFLAKRAEYIKHVPGYLEQIRLATTMDSIGSSQGKGNAFTFAQPDLTTENKKEYYEKHLNEFDGALEQAHDNFHGWAGPDMANNSFAAFDPLFWSFHANFDRIFETWLRTHEEQDWTSNFPLRPFKGREGPIDIIEGDPFTYKYTNIGDMVRNCKTLGYTYGPPGNPDYGVKKEHLSLAVAPIVLFPNTRCTDKTYVIHVALDTGDGKKVVPGEPGYIGSITRLGMGPDTGNDRCIQGGVVRRLEAGKAVQDIGGMEAGSEVKLKLLVMEDGAGKPPREVPEDEYKDMPGFRPLVLWDKPVAGTVAK